MKEGKKGRNVHNRVSREITVVRKFGAHTHEFMSTHINKKKSFAELEPKTTPPKMPDEDPFRFLSHQR